MKTFKNTLLSTLFLVLATLSTNAQNQAYWVHTDYVKPAMQSTYEKVSKDFVEACKKHDLKGADWASVRMDDGRYLTLAPIKNMADFDTNPLAPLAEKMGTENFSALFERFNTCYDKHTDNVIHLISALLYAIAYVRTKLTISTISKMSARFELLHELKPLYFERVVVECCYFFVFLFGRLT